MSELKPENELTGLKILKQAKKQNGLFLLQELNDEIMKIVKGIRQAPNKNGSLNIHLSFKPGSSDGEVVVATAEIKNVKVPTVDAQSIHAFSTMNGRLSSKNPAQPEMFDEATQIDDETGEVIVIKQ